MLVRRKTRLTNQSPQDALSTQWFATGSSEMDQTTSKVNQPLAQPGNSNRRHAERQLPAPDDCVAQLLVNDEQSIVALVCDISSSGIGLLVGDDVSLAIGDTLTVAYREIRGAGTVVNQLDYSTNCNRIGIRWERPNADHGDQLPALKKHLIFVHNRGDGRFLLEQFRQEGRFRVTVSVSELASTVRFLSLDAVSVNHTKESEVLPSGVELRRFADGSFTIQQGADLIYGLGDIRQFLQAIN